MCRFRDASLYLRGCFPKVLEMSKNSKVLKETIKEAHRLLVQRQDRDYVTFMEQAVGKFPNDPEIRLLYATALLTSRPRNAPLEAAKAIQLDPDDSARLTRAARMLFQLGHVDAARSYATRAARLAPANFPLLPELTLLGGLLAAELDEDALAEEGLSTAADWNRTNRNT